MNGFVFVSYSYDASGEKWQRGYEERFLEYLEKLIRDLDKRVQRGKERLQRSADANSNASSLDFTFDCIIYLVHRRLTGRTVCYTARNSKLWEKKFLSSSKRCVNGHGLWFIAFFVSQRNLGDKEMLKRLSS